MAAALALKRQQQRHKQRFSVKYQPNGISRKRIIIKAGVAAMAAWQRHQYRSMALA
jgi:hypothetical protein